MTILQLSEGKRVYILCTIIVALLRMAGTFNTKIRYLPNEFQNEESKYHPNCRRERLFLYLHYECEK